MSEPETSQDELLAPDDVATSQQADAGASDEATVQGLSTPAISEPGKVMRIGSMVKQLLEEVRAAELDESADETERQEMENLTQLTIKGVAAGMRTTG